MALIATASDPKAGWAQYAWAPNTQSFSPSDMTAREAKAANAPVVVIREVDTTPTPRLMTARPVAGTPEFWHAVEKRQVRTIGRKISPDEASQRLADTNAEIARQVKVNPLVREIAMGETNHRNMAVRVNGHWDITLVTR